MLLLRYNFYDPVNNTFTASTVKQPHIVSDIAVADYTNISSIINWANIAVNLIGGFSNFRDWKKWRSEIKSLVNPIISAGSTTTDPRKDWDTLAAAQKTIVTNNFNTLTAEERKIAADFFIVPLDLQLLVTNSVPFWVAKGLSFFDKNAFISRQQRLAVIISEIKNRITTINALELQRESRQVTQGTVVSLNASNQLTASLRGIELTGSYITEGIEGTVEDGDTNSVGISDYILGRSGTPFAGIGLKQKTFTVTGFANMSIFADYLYDILANGKY